MKTYDYAAAKAFIEKNRDKITEASLGMHEDWFWTAETVFENGEFQIDLTQEKLLIGGIKGSDWATPSLQVRYDDGTEEFYPMFNGTNSGVRPPHMALANLGPLSGPMQESMPDLKELP